MHILKLLPFYIIHHKSRPALRVHKADIHIPHLQTIDMPDKKPIGRHRPPPVWFGIVFLELRYLPLRHVNRTTPLIINADIMHLQIFDRMSGQPADDHTMPVVGIVYDDITENDPPAGSYRYGIRAALPGAQPDIFYTHA